MRILQVGKFYWPYQGGIESVIRELSRNLVRRGHRVEVLCCAEGRQAEQETVEGVQVHRRPSFGRAFSQPLVPDFFLHLARLARTADVVHLHCPHPLAELAWMSTRPDRPLVVTHHCDVFRAPWLRGAHARLYRGLLNRSDQVVVSAPQALAHSLLLRGVKAPSQVIPFGIENRAPAARASGARDGRYFLFVGRMVPYKGVDVLLEAVAKTNTRLRLVGIGPELEAMRERARSLALNSQVQFLGPVDDAELARVLAGCEALVLPSVTSAEAFGMALVEAMREGKPVITTALDTGVRFVNRDGVSGLMVPPRNANALAEAMQTLWDDSDSRARLGAGARDRFLAEFTAEKMVERYEAVYRDVCAITSLRNALARSI